MKYYKVVVISSVVFISLLACEDDSGDVQPTDSLTPENSVNNWIFSQLDFWYFWREELPADVSRDQEPDNYFDALKFSGDRFSILVSDFQSLVNSLDGIVLEAGYELSLFQETGTENVLGAITYVKENSPAKDVGLTRGDIIRSINGAEMNTENFRDVLADISLDHSIEYLRFNQDLESFETFTADLTVIQLSENPHFLDTVYMRQNGKKVGYYVYNFFSQGVGSGTEYAEQMDNIFGKFRLEGIDELVLDLRYNGGGAVSASTNLASLIAPSVGSSDIFYRYDWNDQIEQSIINDPSVEADDFFTGNFVVKSENIGDQLTSNRVYVLVGRGTASASELIINGLTPYMEVIIIGETTVGKNVGSITLEDTVNTNSEYGMLPIVFQIANSAGQSDYANGFTPGGLYQVDDLQLPLKALGDVEEPLLATALADIDGTLTGRKRTEGLEGYKTILTSRQIHAERNELVMDDVSPIF